MPHWPPAPKRSPHEVEPSGPPRGAPIEPVRELGPGTVREKWAQPRWLLTVSASAARTVTAPGSAIEEYSQYSLSLEPTTVDPALDGTEPTR